MLGTLTLQMEATVLNYSSCSQPLKPPRVYKCVDIHLIYHSCVGKITSCQKCEYPSGGFTHEPSMDVVLSAARVVCAHKGCGSLLPYYELHQHEITCRYTPCTCTETGYDFATLPPALVIHLTAGHSILVHAIQYATKKAFQELVPLASEVSRWRILVGEKDGVVFVLTICMLDTMVLSPANKMKTQSRGREFAVSLVYVVCVRLALSDSLVYRARMWAECPSVLSWPHGRRMTDTMTLDMEASSSTKPDDVVIEDLTSYLPVLRHYMLGPATAKDLRFIIRVDF